MTDIQQTTGQCNRCKGAMYYDGERWRHRENDSPLLECPSDLRASERAMQMICATVHNGQQTWNQISIGGPMEPTALKFKMAEPEHVTAAITGAIKNCLWADDLLKEHANELVRDINLALVHMGCVVIQLDNDDAT